jgi:acyl-CoA thioesterase FadM
MLRVTHTSSVTEDMIDHLGHMNNRYYAVNAIAGSRSVLADLPGWDDGGYLVHDSYTRYLREQRLGTGLEVRSAVLGLADGGDVVRIHHQLADATAGQLAATFVHGARRVDADGASLPLPAIVREAVEAQAMELPPEGATRTVSLEADLLGRAPSLETLVDRGLAYRKPRQVQPDECGPDGCYLVEMAPELIWGGEAVEGEASDHLYETTSGELMGWAGMETRAVFGLLPTAGTRLQSFAATVAVHDKVTHRMNWAYDLDTGALLTAFESVSMAFDVRGRRPMTIPDDYRRAEAERVQPDLGLPTNPLSKEDIMDLGLRDAAVVATFDIEGRR